MKPWSTEISLYSVFEVHDGSLAFSFDQFDKAKSFGSPFGEGVLSIILSPFPTPDSISLISFYYHDGKVSFRGTLAKDPVTRKRRNHQYLIPLYRVGPPGKVARVRVGERVTDMDWRLQKTRRDIVICDNRSGPVARHRLELMKEQALGRSAF